MANPTFTWMAFMRQSLLVVVAEADDEPKLDTISLLQRLWKWLTSIRDWNSLEGWLGRIVIAVAVVVMVLWLVKKGLVTYVETQKAWKDVGLPVRLSEEARSEVRRRRQFCKVLWADLASLDKAESWNDQYFTDLEAEVEAEGRYYASILDRMRRRQSQGLRRVPSLINAIESSTEAELLVVGEPGSGKSVGLRHLASQLAQRGIPSSDPLAKIPLYVNLKELGPAPPDGPTANFIKTFVLDNIRRGDADTADYVRQNWDRNRDRGIWFFLFDSFDEIPAVMHAPSGSPVIHQHAEAIRRFLTGMGDCRGCLASREFKGPDALPWQKFRILALSSRRQEELVGNAYLDPPQKDVVLRHLASQGTGIYSNPLFLTLLCRFVRQHNVPPINDHDLLERHVLQLAQRDQDYVQKKYGLRPADLVEGATRLAVLFAENRDLSLAPTLDQIKAAVPWDSDSREGLEDLIGALVEVKIGRSDVREARAGDRRFTFSHRRYQETLFVQHLKLNPEHILPRTFLTDPRWREYAVTLLQTQPAGTIRPLLDEAGALLSERAAMQRPTAVLAEFGGELSYYEWKDEPAFRLLQLLQEGLARRLGDVSPELSNAAEAFLGPRWNEGDPFDRARAMDVSSVLPQELLSARIADIIRKPADSDLKQAAFSQVVALRNVPAEFGDWIRGRLGTEIIFARRVELLRLEALAARLPDSVGCAHVLRYCRRLRPLAHVARAMGFRARPLLHMVPGDSVTALAEHRIYIPGLRKLSGRDAEQAGFRLM